MGLFKLSKSQWIPWVVLGGLLAIGAITQIDYTTQVRNGPTILASASVPLATTLASIPAGGTLMIPKGTFSISVPLVFNTANVHVSCQPGAVILQTTPASSLGTISASGVGIDGCTLDGGGSSGGIVIVTDSGAISNLLINNVVFQNLISAGGAVEAINNTGINGILNSAFTKISCLTVNGCVLLNVFSGLIIRDMYANGTTDDVVHLLMNNSLTNGGCGVVLDHIVGINLGRDLVELQGPNWKCAALVQNSTAYNFTSAAIGNSAISEGITLQADTTNAGATFIGRDNNIYDPGGYLAYGYEILSDRALVTGGEIQGSAVAGVGTIGVKTGAADITVSYVHFRGLLGAVTDNDGAASPRLHVEHNRMEEMLGACASVASNAAGDVFAFNVCLRTAGFYTSDNGGTWIGWVVSDTPTGSEPIRFLSNYTKLLSGTTTGMGAVAYEFALAAPGTSFDNEIIEDTNGSPILDGFIDAGSTNANMTYYRGGRYLNLALVSNYGAGDHIVYRDNTCPTGATDSTCVAIVAPTVTCAYGTGSGNTGSCSGGVTNLKFFNGQLYFITTLTTAGSPATGSAIATFTILTGTFATTPLPILSWVGGSAATSPPISLAGTSATTVVMTSSSSALVTGNSYTYLILLLSQ